MILKSCVFGLLLATASIYADGQGETLEREMWDNMKSKNWEALENKIAPYFQSVHADGPRTRGQEIELMKNLNLGVYTLTNFRVTEQGDQIIVTYLATVPETIDRDRTSTIPAPRLSVWQKTYKGWQWIAHANLSEISDDGS